MLDIDPRLDARLRAFYEHIEEQAPSRDLAAFQGPLTRPRRRTFPVLAGVAVVAAAVGLFVTQLSSNHTAPAGRSSGPGLTLPSAARLTAGLPSISHTVIRVTHGRGSFSLPTFTPEGMVFIVWSCAGSGPISVQSTNQLIRMFGDACEAPAANAINGEITVPPSPPIDGKPLSLQIVAPSSTIWEIVVADSGPVPPLPTLGGTSLPTGAHVLVASTYGTGTTGLLTFVPKGQYYVQYACTGSGTIDFSTSDGSRNWTSQNCANGTVETQEGVKAPSTQLINLTVEAAQRTLWEVVVYELPGPKT